MHPNGIVWDRRLLWIFAAALAVRGAVLVFASADLRTLLVQPWEYEGVAQNLLSGEGFVGPFKDSTPYRALVHPVYPAFCAALYWLVGGPSPIAVQLVQSLLLIPAGWMGFRLAATLAGARAGLLAASGIVFHPALLFFSLRLHALWLDAVIFLTVLSLVFEVSRSPGARQLFALGLAMGFGLLSRSSIVCFILIACVWLLRQWRRPLPVALPRLAMILGLALLVAAPWLVRNALIFGRPTGMLTLTGYSLWIGNNPAATGGALNAQGEGLTDPILDASLSGLSELEQQDAYRQVALAYMVDHPLQTAWRYLVKLRTFFFWSAQTGAWYPQSFSLPYKLFYLMLLGCALVGAGRLRHVGLGSSALLLLLFVASVGIIQSVFFVEGRHRWEVEWGFVILAACAFGLNAGVEHEKTHRVSI